MAVKAVCGICARPDVATIDQDCIRPGVSLRSVATKYGVGRGPIQRHAKKHVRARLQKAVKERQNGSDPDLLEELQYFARAVRHVLGHTIHEENWPNAIGAIRAGLEQLRLKGELLGEIKPNAPAAGYVIVFDRGTPKTVPAIETTAQEVEDAIAGGESKT